MNIKKMLKGALDFVKYYKGYTQCIILHYDPITQSTVIRQTDGIDDAELSNLIFKMWLDCQESLKKIA